MLLLLSWMVERKHCWCCRRFMEERSFVAAKVCLQWRKECDVVVANGKEEENSAVSTIGGLGGED